MDASSEDLSTALALTDPEEDVHERRNWRTLQVRGEHLVAGMVPLSHVMMHYVTENAKEFDKIVTNGLKEDDEEKKTILTASLKAATHSTKSFEVTKASLGRVKQLVQTVRSLTNVNRQQRLSMSTLTDRLRAKEAEVEQLRKDRELQDRNFQIEWKTETNNRLASVLLEGSTEQRVFYEKKYDEKIKAIQESSEQRVKDYEENISRLLADNLKMIKERDRLQAKIKAQQQEAKAKAVTVPIIPPMPVLENPEEKAKRKRKK